MVKYSFRDELAGFYETFGKKIDNSEKLKGLTDIALKRGASYKKNYSKLVDEVKEVKLNKIQRQYANDLIETLNDYITRSNNPLPGQSSQLDPHFPIVVQPDIPHFEPSIIISPAPTFESEPSAITAPQTTPTTPILTPKQPIQPKSNFRRNIAAIGAYALLALTALLPGYACLKHYQSNQNPLANRASLEQRSESSSLPKNNSDIARARQFLESSKNNLKSQISKNQQPKAQTYVLAPNIPELPTIKPVTVSQPVINDLEIFGPEEQRVLSRINRYNSKQKALDELDASKQKPTNPTKQRQSNSVKPFKKYADYSESPVIGSTNFSGSIDLAEEHFVNTGKRLADVFTASSFNANKPKLGYGPSSDDFVSYLSQWGNGISEPFNPNSGAYKGKGPFARPIGTLGALVGGAIKLPAESLSLASGNASKRVINPLLSAPTEVVEGIGQVASSPGNLIPRKGLGYHFSRAYKSSVRFVTNVLTGKGFANPLQAKKNFDEKGEIATLETAADLGLASILANRIIESSSSGTGINQSHSNSGVSNLIGTRVRGLGGN